MRLFSSSSMKQSVSRLGSFVPSSFTSCFNVKSSLLVRCQDLPAEINPITFLNLVTQQYRRFCPAGIVKCECMLAPGNFTTGPFDGDEDPVGLLISELGCSPGKRMGAECRRRTIALCFKKLIITNRL